VYGSSNRVILVGFDVSHATYGGLGHG
jgi:hypothetical protein